MSSFLAECPQCKNTIAKNSICPNCNYSEANENKTCESSASDTIEIFAQRRRIHNKNFKNSMLLKMIAGLLAATTFVCWFLFLYLGSLTAFVGIGALTVVSGILGLMVFKFEQIYPIALNCPGCEERLDTLNISFDKCPGCYSRLT